MTHWDNIDDIARKSLKRILLQNDKDTGFSTSEKSDVLTSKYKNWDILVYQSREALKYDANRAFRKLQTQKYDQGKWIIYSSVAASILLVISIFFLQESTEVSPVMGIEPGNKKATLILSDGTSRDIRDAKEIIRVKDSKLQIDSSGLTVAAAPITNLSKEQEYQTLSVPRGGEYNLTLSDGTRVWLNSESELRFPMHFDKDQRVVYCKGEVYFEASHNSQAPFIVKLTKGDITVLGTEFCTSDYNADRPQVTLVTGKVRFTTHNGDSVVMAPSQHLVYDANVDRLSTREVNTRRYTAWRDKLFYFDDETLEEIMHTLSRWYDVEIHFESDELQQRHFSGIIEKYEEITTCLEIFQAGTNINFKIDGQTIRIKK